MSEANFLEKLLDGIKVEWLTLGQVAEVSAAGVDKKINDNEVPVKLLNFMDVYRNRYIDKSIPQMEVTAKESKIESCNILAGDIFITPSSEVKDDIGNSAVAIEDLKGVVYSYHVMRLRLKKPSMITSMFISYALSSNIVQSQINMLAKGLTRFGLTKTQWEDKIQIPIPCPDDPKKSLAIQGEIVRILDTFTALTAELTAELTARKKQYNYYRDKLLTFSDGKRHSFLEKLLDGVEVEWKSLGDAVEIQRGKRLVKSQLEETGNFAVFQNSMTPLGYYHESNVEPDSAFIICAGAAGEIGYSAHEFWAADDVHFFRPPKGILSKFLYHWLLTQQNQISGQVRKASIPRLSKSVIEKLSFPIPCPDDPKKSLTIQSEIVRILDKFDTIAHSLQEGLPREIELRQKQYEYYRDLLLSFPKAEEVAA